MLFAWVQIPLGSPWIYLKGNNMENLKPICPEHNEEMRLEYSDELGFTGFCMKCARHSLYVWEQGTCQAA